MRVATAYGCNIYYLVNDLCLAGVLDDPQTYTKPAGSSTTLVAVRILASTLTNSIGTKVKPGTFERNNCLKFFIISQN
jgi:hypothetical protein